MARVEQYPPWWEFYFDLIDGRPDSSAQDLFAEFLRVKNDGPVYLRDHFKVLVEPIDDLLDMDRELSAAMDNLESWWRDTMTRVDLRTKTKTSYSLWRLFESKNSEPATSQYLSAILRSDPLTSHDILYVKTLIADVAVLLGNAFAYRVPEFCWAINDDAGDKRRRLPEAGKIVVWKPAAENRPPISFDFYGNLIRSYERLFAAHQNKTVAVRGCYNSDFPGWDVVNAVNGFCG